MLRQLSVVASLGLYLCLLGCSEAQPAEDEPVSASLQALRGTWQGSSRAVRDSIKRTGARLADLQADLIGDPAHNRVDDADPDDGGWDWVLAPSDAQHTATASPENLFGAVGLAPWAASRVGGEPSRLRAVLFNAARGTELNAAVDSPPDFVFLVLLSDSLHASRYAALARERYDARVAAVGGAEAFAVSIRDGHAAAALDGLVAYDLAWLALSAAALDVAYPRGGYRADFNSYVGVVLNDLAAAAPVFDYRDAHEPYYLQGLAWSTLVASWSRSSSALFLDLRTQLLSLQLPNGAWAYNADFPDAHLQATAHALMALGLARHAHSAPNAVTGLASSWLMQQQAENGGFPYSLGEEYPLLDAEIALGLYLSETSLGAREGLLPDGPARASLSVTVANGAALPPLAAPFAAP